MTDTTNQPLIDAVANLIKVKGRFHTEQAYKQLVEAYDAAIEASRTPAAQEVSDADILKLFYKEHGEGFALYEVTPGNMVAFSRALLSLAAPKVPDDFVIVQRERNYDMRAKAIIEFNTASKDGKDLDDALQAAWDASLSASAAPSAPQAEGNEWISVDERLPTHIYSVLGWVVDSPFVAFGTDPMCDIVSYDPGRGVWIQFVGDDDAVVEVSHWQDLPDAPIAAAPMKGEE